MGAHGGRSEVIEQRAIAAVAYYLAARRGQPAAGKRVAEPTSAR
jgi:hypothetical protein